MPEPAKTDHHPLTQRLKAPGPKRILALDGGGIRGALSLGYLKKIEDILRERYHDPDYRLCQYFDLIGGTSIGSIIAASLAKGMSVQEIIDVYLRFGPAIFSKKRFFAKGIFKYLHRSTYLADQLEQELDKVFEDYTLGDKRLKTGLCIVAKRADTFSTWAFHNHPKGHYSKENEGIKLKDLLRASSAAPSYFTPKGIRVAGEELGVFIDGGVSSSNNPALLMFLMATLKGYPFQWEMGKDKMLIVSIGTGYHRPRAKNLQKVLNKRSFQWAPELPNIFMIDANFQNQMLLQFFAESYLPQKINAEVGNLENDYIAKEPLMSYVRYNVRLDQNTLQALGWDGDTDDQSLNHLRQMDQGMNADRLHAIGAKSAEKIVKNWHFAEPFDFRFSASPKALKSQPEMLAHVRNILQQSGTKYRKDKHIWAREVTREEHVVSITSAGVETSNVAMPGDFIVKNQTTAQELYIVKPDVFNEKYQFLRKTDAIWNEYAAHQHKGLIVAIELTPEALTELEFPNHFFFEPAWGGVQYAGLGDFIVAPTNMNEVYRIGRKEFFETYTPYLGVQQ